MQPDYQKMMEREQKRYQETRDPFEYGRQVAQRRYSEIMSGLDAQRASAQQSYGDMYQAARQRAIGQQAAGGQTLSGGMGQQQKDYISSLEMQELSKISQGREQAQRDLYTQAQSAMANAQLEGQQATQMQLQNQQMKLDLISQRNAIETDNSLSPEQKAERLQALGFDTKPEDVEARTGTVVGDLIKAGGLAVGTKFGLWAIGAIGAKLGAGAAVTVLASSPVGWAIAGVAAAIYGLDKLSERFGWFGGDLIGFA